MDLEILLQFSLAALWGGIVGLEREYRSKSAGFRTMIMISLGSCFFTIMSLKIGTDASHDRIASNILTGIGFLGAGVIFRGTETRISGITTAATIWAVAAIGMGIGAGYYFAAGAASLIIIFVLSALPWAEYQIDKLRQTKTYTIQKNNVENPWLAYEAVMRDCKLVFRQTGLIRQTGIVIMTWEVRGSAKAHSAFCHFVLQDPSVERYEY
jgi:putative Mg2+ transporter-C (MgtC) family protein